MRLASDASSINAGRSKTKKSQRTDFAKKRDCITNLPQAILDQILSCLPTKDAVRTCVLSKRWKYKWTSTSNFDIQDRKARKAVFVNFVCRVLVLANSIRHLRLSCLEECDLSCMIGWISTALKHELESFVVKYSKPGIILPCSLLHCPSLRKLELVLPCIFRVPSTICFPNLNTLHLEGIAILNGLSISAPLVFSFPVLETFELIDCKWLGVNFVEINAPALMTFKTKTTYDSTCNGYTIKILASKLANFESSGGISENILFTGSQVVFAVFTCTGRTHVDSLNSGRRVLQLLKEFSSLEELKISPVLILPLYWSNALPQYGNLRRLVILDSISHQMLLWFLHKAPSLKFLFIGMGHWAVPLGNDDVYEPVPSCILSHLEEVRVSNFQGSTLQLRLVKFVLKNGGQLKKLFLSLSDKRCVQKDELVEQLAFCPKASTCLVVAVS